MKLWRNDGTVLHRLQHNDKVNTVRFNPNGKVIASASDVRTVRLWNIDDTSFHAPLQHNDKVNMISFSRDGNLLASVSDDKTVKLWDKNRNLINTLNHDDKVANVAFSPDGKALVSASIDGTLKVWSSNRQEITTTKGSPPMAKRSPLFKVMKSNT